MVQEGPAPFRMEFSERLRWLLDLFETRVEAGAVAGVTPEHLPSYISGKAKPRFDAIARLAAAKNVSLDWLATGRGPRSAGEAAADGFVPVDVLPDAEAQLGENVVAPVLFSRILLKAVTTAPDEALRLVVHRGNSNEPVIRSGDVLLVDTSVQRIAEDGLYVFPRDGRYLAKFVETFLNGRVALKSRNPDYGVQTLPQDEASALQVLGRVCWRGGLF